MNQLSHLYEFTVDSFIQHGRRAAYAVIGRPLLPVYALAR